MRVVSVATVLLASASGPTDAVAPEVVGGLQLGQARADRTPRDPRGARHPGDAAAADGGRLGCGGKSAGPFVEERGEHLESGSDLGFSGHALQHIAESGIRYAYFVAHPKGRRVEAVVAPNGSITTAAFDVPARKVPKKAVALDAQKVQVDPNLDGFEPVKHKLLELRQFPGGEPLVYVFLGKAAEKGAYEVRVFANGSKFSSSPPPTPTSKRRRSGRVRDARRRPQG